MEEPTYYNSMADIRRRKSVLRGELRESEKEISLHWKKLFHSGKVRRKSTPSRRLSTLISTGIGIVDGLLLGWKLYCRFRLKGKFI